MMRVPILAGIALVVLGCSEAPDLNVIEDARQSIPARSSNQLVHVEGKFVSIHPTSKRHQSFVFTFRIQDGLHGPGQAPTPKDELIRFELYQDFGGRDLVAELSGRNPPGGVALADAAKSVTNSHVYQLVLWRFPSHKVYGGEPIDAQLVGLPVPVRE